MNRNEMVRYIDDALTTYAGEIMWGVHPRSDRFWNFEGAIHYSLIRKTNAKNIIEFGTEQGMSTRFLVEAAVKNRGFVTTVELNLEHIKVAQQSLSGLPVRFLNIDARDVQLDESYDYIFYDAEHEAYMVTWYKEKLLPLAKGWFSAHDIDVNQDIINARTNGEFNEFPKVFADKYVTAREMMGHTSYRPPFEGYDSGWMNSSAFMYMGE